MPLLLALALSTGSSSVAPEVHARTKALAQQATASFGAGKFAAALTRFEEAFENEPLPILLFNMAECQKALGRWHLTAELAQRYLDTQPEGIGLERGQKLLAEAQSMAGITPSKPSEAHPLVLTPEPAPPQMVPATPGANSKVAAERPPRAMPTGALVLLIAGGVVLATGLAFWAVDLGINGQNTHSGNTNTISLSQAQLQNTSVDISVPANITGALALSAGLGWWLFTR